jgi:glycerate kinase
LRVLVAPDSFKGSLSSTAAAQALADGWRIARPDDTIRTLPLADGGDGMLDALKATGTDWLELPVHARDALDRPVRATFLRHGDTGVIELASASGLTRISPAEHDPLRATTFGTGQVLAAAIGLGVRHVVLGLGGSATTDGGAGLIEALGARLLDTAGQDLARGGGSLGRLARLDLSGLSAVLGEVHVTVASDVTNPLLGEQGAAAIYGPQKGADEQQVAKLDANLAHYANVLEAATAHSVRNVPGAGAAGGTTAGLLAIADHFASFEVRPGAEVVMELTGFADALSSSDLVLTGEGRIDAQTAFGKTVLGIASRARDARVGCICFAGGISAEGAAALARLGAICVPVVEQPMSVEQAIAAGRMPLVRAAERTARLVSLGAAPNIRE